MITNTKTLSSTSRSTSNSSSASSSSSSSSQKRSVTPQEVLTVINNKRSFKEAEKKIEEKNQLMRLANTIDSHPQLIKIKFWKRLFTVEELNRFEVYLRKYDKGPSLRKAKST